MKLQQLKLSYDRNELAPSISEDAIDYHYGKLYKAYVDRFNDNEGDPDFNEAGAFLHDIYFSQFQSPDNSNKPTGSISEFINKHFKSFESFKEEFEKVAMGIQGSGWVYLSKDGKIKTITNHAIKKDIVLLIDWWEHAWVLDYQHDKKKYLENQWKIINWNSISGKVGLIQESKVGISFIRELKESRYIQSESDVKLSYTSMCEALYLSVLAIEFLSRTKKGQDIAERYAKQTATYSLYDQFRFSGTDLYNFIYYISASPDRVEKLFKSSDAKILREKTHLPLMALNGWLISLLNPQNRDLGFFMRLEQALSISSSDLKEIRRMLSYRNPAESDIANMSYRILNAYRNKMPMFDLLPDLERVCGSKISYTY
jgi:Fe-Mn family superoxide dismutase